MHPADYVRRVLVAADGCRPVHGAPFAALGTGLRAGTPMGLGTDGDGQNQCHGCRQTTPRGSDQGCQVAADAAVGSCVPVMEEGPLRQPPGGGRDRQDRQQAVEAHPENPVRPQQTVEGADAHQGQQHYVVPQVDAVADFAEPQHRPVAQQRPRRRAVESGAADQRGQGQGGQQMPDVEQPVALPVGLRPGPEDEDQHPGQGRSYQEQQRRELLAAGGIQVRPEFPGEQGSGHADEELVDAPGQLLD